MATTTKTSSSRKNTTAAATPASKKLSADTSPPKAKKVTTKSATQPTAKVATPRTRKKTIAQESAPMISDEHRRHMIATAAYYLAEKRGFGSGNEMEDWITAEAYIDTQIKR